MHPKPTYEELEKRVAKFEQIFASIYPAKFPGPFISGVGEFRKPKDRESQSSYPAILHVCAAYGLGDSEAYVRIDLLQDFLEARHKALDNLAREGQKFDGSCTDGPRASDFR